MSDSSTATQELTLKVSESTGKDVGRGLARIDPADMHQLGAEIGNRHADFQIKSTTPQGPVVIASDTLPKIGGIRSHIAGPSH